MTTYEIQSLINCIISFIASIGYFLRIVGNLKNNSHHRYFLILPLFFIGSLGMSMIYFFNISGLWRVLEPDFELYSRLYIRPYFTYMGSVLLLASWTHPEVTPIIKNIRSHLWMILKKR